MTTRLPSGAAQLRSIRGALLLWHRKPSTAAHSSVSLPTLSPTGRPPPPNGLDASLSPFRSLSRPPPPSCAHAARPFSLRTLRYRLELCEEINRDPTPRSSSDMLEEDKGTHPDVPLALLPASYVPLPESACLYMCRYTWVNGVSVGERARVAVVVPVMLPALLLLLLPKERGLAVARTVVRSPPVVVVVVVVVVLSSGAARAVCTVHGPVGIGCGQRVASWMGIDQPGGQQDAFAGYLLYPPPPSPPAPSRWLAITYTLPSPDVTHKPTPARTTPQSGLYVTPTPTRPWGAHRYGPLIYGASAEACVGVPSSSTRITRNVHENVRGIASPRKAAEERRWDGEGEAGIGHGEGNALYLQSRSSAANRCIVYYYKLSLGESRRAMSKEAGRGGRGAEGREREREFRKVEGGTAKRRPLTTSETVNNTSMPAGRKVEGDRERLTDRDEVPVDGTNKAAPSKRAAYHHHLHILSINQHRARSIFSSRGEDDGVEAGDGDRWIHGEMRG
ncbi:hypothetical protein KM043_002299 [Ampulex compressa]|nr:hypothetical protein KM043_002299 [Ampulex compressa]